MNTTHEQCPAKGMTVTAAAFLGVGAMVGAGIFALLGEAGEGATARSPGRRQPFAMR